MEENPTVRLEPEVVGDLPNPEPVVPPVVEPKQETTWSKFPPQVDRSSSNKPSKRLMWLVIILIAIAVAVIGLVLRQFMFKGNGVRTVVSDENMPTPTEEPTPTPSPTPEIIEKSEVKVQVLNASGITGRAGKVASALKAVDFEDVVTGNADADDQIETVIEYSTKVDSKLVEEIEAEVRKMFTSVRTIANATLEQYHVIISTGTDEATE